MIQTNQHTLLRDLGDGLILRRSTPLDAEKLGAFNSMIHSDDGPEKPDDRLGAWTSDLLTRPHPTFGSADFTIVEEQATGRIVSSLNLISQTWAYAGIPFKVGRPELVGTLPEFVTAARASSSRRSTGGAWARGVVPVHHRHPYHKRFEYDGARAGGGRVTSSRHPASSDGAGNLSRSAPRQSRHPT
jgi:hypothetical protein